jgi:hypothetical protein
VLRDFDESILHCPHALAEGVPYEFDSFVLVGHVNHRHSRQAAGRSGRAMDIAETMTAIEAFP